MAAAVLNLALVAANAYYFRKFLGLVDAFAEATALTRRLNNLNPEEL